MSTDFSVNLKDAEELERRLDQCYSKLDAIPTEDRYKYENPQYRLWSGNVKDVQGFVDKLEEWLNQPAVAESKRFLEELRKLAETSEETIPCDIESDWRFLSDYLEEIKHLDENVKAVVQKKIQKDLAIYVLRRIVEKDIRRALAWSQNALQFSGKLAEFEKENAKSKLASEVKKDSVKLLLKETSFDTNNDEELVEYSELRNKAEVIIQNKPEEIVEDAILNSYHKYKSIGESLNAIIFEIDKIKTFLINLEWIKEFSGDTDYSLIRNRKVMAVNKGDLESINREFDNVSSQVESWKSARKKEIDSVLSRIERLKKLVENGKLHDTSLQSLKHKVDWNKPSVDRIFETLSEATELEEKLKRVLVEKLKNEDAISIVEAPETIHDLGKSKGWEFERFMKALEVVLWNGLVTIKAEDLN